MAVALSAAACLVVPLSCTQDIGDANESVQECTEIAIGAECPIGTAPQTIAAAQNNGTHVIAEGEGGQFDGSANVGILVNPGNGECAYVCVPYVECPEGTPSLCLNHSCYLCCEHGVDTCSEEPIWAPTTGGGAPAYEGTCTCKDPLPREPGGEEPQDPGGADDESGTMETATGDTGTTGSMESESSSADSTEGNSSVTTSTDQGDTTG